MRGNEGGRDHITICRVRLRINNVPLTSMQSVCSHARYAKPLRFRFNHVEQMANQGNTCDTVCTQIEHKPLKKAFAEWLQRCGVVNKCS